MLGDARDRDPRPRSELPDRDLARVVERADNSQPGRVAEQCEPACSELEKRVGDDRDIASLRVNIKLVN